LQAGGLRGAITRLIAHDVIPAAIVFVRHLPLERLPQVRSAPEGVQLYVRNLHCHTAHGLRGAWHTLMQRPDHEDRLGEIRAPTLIVVGDRDNLVAPSRLMHERIAGSRFVLIKDSPHGTADWQPEAFNAAVLEFLEDVQGSR
jgi:pimeloyl-ACP methyl ester carboxylesterase